MEIINILFSKAGLSKDEWLLNLNDFEKGNIINKSKDNSIYEVKDKNTNNSYAAKVFNKKMNTTNEYEKAKIPQILQFQPNLKHKSILQIKGISPVDFNQKNMPVLIMEYASNGNLSDFLEKGLKKSKYSNLTFTEKLINIYGIASAMKYLHSQDIVHRQLETSSVILDEFKYPKLFKNKNIKKVSELSQSNKVDIFVSPSFVAPETWEHKLYTKKSDVYSFSMIVYEIITNQKPQQKHKMINKIIKDVVTKKYRPIIPSNVPRCYQDLIKSCWSDDPEKRPTFSDIVDLLKTNEEFLLNRVDRNKYDQYIKILDPHNDEPQNDSLEQQPSSPTNKPEQQPSSPTNKSKQLYSSTRNRPKQKHLSPNIIIDMNAYTILSLIKEFDYYKIFKILEKQTNKMYLAKICSNEVDMNSEDELALGYINEVSIMKIINYPSIIKFIGFSPFNFLHENKPTIIMEYASNGALSNILEMEEKGLSLPEWNHTKKLINIYGIASGMKYLHSQDIIHRDLKPSNILEDEYLFPKITDFGLSKSINSDEGLEYMKGTPIYMAPEIFRKNEYSMKSDVYSFAYIVYEIFSGQKPFKDLNYTGFLFRIFEGMRPEMNSSIPTFYQNLISKCWSEDPSQRPSFSEIVEILTTKEAFPETVDEGEFWQYVDYINTYSSNIQKSGSSNDETDSSNLQNSQKSDSSIHETDSSMDEEDSSTSKMFLFQSDSQISKQLSSNANSTFVKQSYMDKINELIDSKIIVDLNDFEISRQIGEGTFAKTFEIKNKKTKDIYAAKISVDEVDFHSESIVLLREVKIMSKINHPSIIKFIGFSPFNFSHKNKPIIIMEYASNGALSDILGMEEKGLSPQGWDYTKKLINIYGIASGMKYLHSQDIIHRDLKPSNILEDEHLFPKITDFGLSKNINLNSTDNIILSNQELKGTPLYMAPEIFKKYEYSKKSDVYSFAYIVYEILSVCQPFKGFNAIKIMAAISQDKRPEIDSTIPTFFRDLISKCWSSDPSQRPSFSEIVEMLKKDNLFEDISKEGTSFEDLIDINEYLKYVDFIDLYFESKSQGKVSYTPQENEKVFKIDYGPLLKSKMIVVSVSIPKIDLENYNKKELIGSGSFAKVYNIENKETGEIYAAKILKKKDQFLSDTEKLCVLREINILSKIKYESIIKFIGYSSYNFKKIERFVFVTEIAKNGSLGTILKLERKGLAIDLWDNTKKLINIYGIACGMKHLHENSIIHRDLKPDNILLDEYLYPKITDFGLSKSIHDEQISQHQVLVIGTPAYISPEIWKSEKHSYESDVYAFALIVYEIVTGEKIVKNIINTLDLMNEVKDNHYRPKFDFPIPDCYKNLIESCWSEEKSKRPTFTEIVEYMKKNSKFIENIDFEEFLLYTELVGEPYPIQNKTKPEKNVNKVSIPHTEKEISELTISAFNKIIEKDHSFSNCFLNLDRFEEKKVIKKSDFFKIVKVVEKETKKIYAARISNIDMNQFTENEMREISNEMVKISKIRHPCILKFVGFSPKSFKNESKPVVITKYEKMIQLKEILINERKKGFILDSTSKLKLIFGLASAMNCLHSNGIIHRNLTPSSIFITKSFNPLLCEFGLCSHLLIMESLTFQSTNQIKTLPIYSAPEILSSKENTQASDVYSFGLIVYELFAYEKPFSNVLNISQLYDEVVVKNKRPILPDVIAECYKDLIKSCWNQNPNERPKFIDIVDVLKNDKRFITSEVNKESYLKYVSKFY